MTWLSTFIHNPETHAFKNPSNWTVEHDATDETNERLRPASGREPAVVVRAGGVDHLRPVRAVKRRWVLVEHHGSAAARTVVDWFGTVELTADEVADIHRQIVTSSFRLYPAEWFQC